MNKQQFTDAIDMRCLMVTPPSEEGCCFTNTGMPLQCDRCVNLADTLNRRGLRGTGSLTADKAKLADWLNTLMTCVHLTTTS